MGDRSEREDRILFPDEIASDAVGSHHRKGDQRADSAADSARQLEIQDRRTQQLAYYYQKRYAKNKHLRDKVLDEIRQLLHGLPTKERQGFLAALSKSLRQRVISVDLL
jgi:hypothetical protein